MKERGRKIGCTKKEKQIILSQFKTRALCSLRLGFSVLCGTQAGKPPLRTKTTTHHNYGDTHTPSQQGPSSIGLLAAEEARRQPNDTRVSTRTIIVVVLVILACGGQRCQAPGTSETPEQKNKTKKKKPLPHTHTPTRRKANIAVPFIARTCMWPILPATWPGRSPFWEVVQRCAWGRGVGELFGVGR